MHLELSIPWPPSANKLHACYRGRKISTPAYRAWRADCLERLSTLGGPRGHDGPVRVTVNLYPGTRMRFDADNKLKPVLDMLVALGVIVDDDSKHVREVLVRVCQTANKQRRREFGRYGWAHVVVEGIQ